MRNLFVLLFLLTPLFSRAQVVLSGNPTYTDACPSTNYTNNPCGNGNYYLGDNTIKLRGIVGTGSLTGKLVLFVSKCDGSPLSNNLTVYLKKRAGTWASPTDILCQADYEEGWTYGTGGAYYAKAIDPSIYQAGSYSFICIVRSGNNSYYTHPVYATFVNNSPPTITITSPTSGNYAIDNSMYIGWSSQNVSGNVSIEAIRSSDGAKFIIADPTSNDGSYSWQIGRDPNTGAIATAASSGSRFTTGTSYQIKMYPTGTSGTGFFSQQFYVPSPSISISSPIAQNYAGGTTLPIRWSSSGFGGTVSIQLLTASGTADRTIADGISNTGSYDWTIPAGVTPGNYKIKMYATGWNLAVAESSVFTVSQPTWALEMASNVTFGATTLQTGTTYTANFSVRNYGNAPWTGSMYVQIDGLSPSLDAGYYTINAGATRNYTVSYTPATTNVGNNKAVQARYQTGGSGSSVQVPGQTITYINIVQPTSPITLGTLPTSMSWNCSQTLNWTSTQAGNVSIELIRASDNQFVAYIADGIAGNSGSNSRNWTVGKDKDGNHINNVAGGTYKLKIYPTGSNGQGTISNTSFTIPNPTLTISQPTATTYQPGQVMPISWAGSAYCGPTVTIEYTSDSGQNSQYVVQNVNNTGNYNWTLPTTLAAGSYRVKVYVPVVGGGSSPVSNSSVVFTVGGTTAPCPNCITGQTQSNFSTQEHFCAAQYLCQQGIIMPAQTLDPKGTIRRDDLAKIVYGGLIGTATTLAENFDVPFVDIPRSATYAQYVKVLSYLDYADGRQPFNRDRTIFYPANPISRQDVVKVILEAWNIDESTASGVSPFSDVPNPNYTTGENLYYYQYIKKAHELAVVTGFVGGVFSPTANCSREDAFLLLYRILTKPNITKPTLDQVRAGLFTPNNLRSDNMGLGVGTDRGNFNHYTKTSFAIDGTVPLVFAHSYNSYATELPMELFPGFMGWGWTHSFNCYIVTNFTDPNDPARRRIVHYPDGALHFYVQQPNGTWTPETLGVFDTMTQGIGYVEITTPGKIVYRFETQDGKSGNYILLRSIRDRNNNTLTFTNELGAGNFPRLRAVSDPQGRTLNFSYLSGENYLTSVSLSGVGPFNGRNIQFNYNNPPIDGGPDRFRDLASYTEPAATGGTKQTTYAYSTAANERHLLRTITLPKGNVITNTYIQRKLRSSETLSSGGGVQKMTVDWAPNYASSGVTSTGQVSVQDGNGLTKATTTQHNNNGLPINIQTNGTNPVNLSLNYGLAGDQTAVTNLNQNGTSVGIEYYTTAPYNPRYVRTQGPNGTITQSYAYNSFNDISSFTNGRGFTTTFDYNSTGNLTQINYPVGQPTRISRNANGTVSQLTTPTSVVTNFVYNVYGNLAGSSTQNGSNPAITSSATYDELSRLKTNTDARGNTTSYDYYANDLVQKLTAPLGYNVTYGYDANDNSISVTNAKGNATTMNYHLQTDQLMSRSFAGQTESFTYYDDGSLKTFTNKRGNTFTFTYDASGRVLSDSYATYTYDTDGTLNTVTNSRYTLDFDYDILKRVSRTTCGGFAVEYGYDNNNNRTRLTYPNNTAVTYNYDGKDRLISLTDWANRQTTFNYDDDGKLLLTTLPSGARVSYSYDAAGRPTGMRHEKSNLTTICSYSYTLDQGGNHLEEVVVEPYLTVQTVTPGTTNYTTDAANRTTQAGSRSYGFDGNGAMSNQNGQPLTWDSRDNLLTAYGTTFYYDGNETRRAKTGRRYLIDELTNSIMAETDENGNYLYYYVHGPTGLLYRQNASNGALEFYHYDFRGSTVATTDQNQNIVRKYQYDAYGNILQQSPATGDDNPFRYVGQYGVQYEQPNLYFMRARYYDPTIGKFLSEDPIWNTNLYAYAEGNPVMGIDPGGEDVYEANAGGTVAAGVKLGVNVSYRWDDNGNSAFYVTPSAGIGLEAGVDGQVCVYPNATNLKDVEDSSIKVTASAGGEIGIVKAGADWSITDGEVTVHAGPYSTNAVSEGLKGKEVKHCLGAGAGAGVSISVSKTIKATTTNVYPTQKDDKLYGAGTALPNPNLSNSISSSKSGAVMTAPTNKRPVRQCYGPIGNQKCIYLYK